MYVCMYVCIYLTSDPLTRLWFLIFFCMVGHILFASFSKKKQTLSYWLRSLQYSIYWLLWKKDFFLVLTTQTKKIFSEIGPLMHDICMSQEMQFWFGFGFFATVSTRTALIWPLRWCCCYIPSMIGGFMA